MYRRPAPTIGATWRFPPYPPLRPCHPPMTLAVPTTAARAASPSYPKSPNTAPNRCPQATTWGCSMTTTTCRCLMRLLSRSVRPRNAAHGSAGFPRPQRRNRLMSQYRLNLFIQHEHAKRLDELAAKKACRSPASLPLPWRPGCRPTRATSAKPRLPSGWIACRGRPSAWSATRTSDRNAGAVHPLLPDRQHAGARSPSGRGPRPGQGALRAVRRTVGPAPAAWAQPGARCGGRTVSRAGADG